MHTTAFTHAHAGAAGAEPRARSAQPGLEPAAPRPRRDHSSQGAAPAEPAAAEGPPPHPDLPFYWSRSCQSAGGRWAGFLRPPLG